MHEEGRILILDMLDVLRKHTNKKHRLKQIEIINLLEKHYGYKDLYNKRKTVRRHLENLIHHEGQYRNDRKVSYRIVERKGYGEADTVEVMTDFGYNHLFQQTELRLLIDSLLLSPRIPSLERKELIEKLESLSSKHFKSRLNRVRTPNTSHLLTQDLFENIECLEDAIEENKKISFYYANYTVNGRNELELTNRLDSHGEDRIYTINPYELVATDGRYYLICNNDSFDNVSHYRIDRMMNIEMLDLRRKPMKEVRGLENGLDLSQYMTEHIYMFGGQSTMVSLRFKKHVLNEFIDWFGTDGLYFSNQSEDEVTVTVKANETAVRKWALQYVLHVTVTSPKSLVEDIKEDLCQAMKRYENE